MSEPRITIALDAMGGDRAPDAIVAGAVRAVAEVGVSVLLVGREEEVRAALAEAGPELGDIVGAAGRDHHRRCA